MTGRTAAIGRQLYLRLAAVFAACVLVLWGCDGDSASDADVATGDTGDTTGEDTGADADAAPDVSFVEIPDGAVDVTVGDEVVATVDERFISFAVDSSQVVGGLFWDPEGMGGGGALGSARVDPYDFSRPRLRRLVQELAPGYVRIGGSEADVLLYDLGDDPPEEAPEPYEWVLTREQVDGIIDFAEDLDFEILFTLNAGPSARDADNTWTPDNARVLMEYMVAEGAPVGVWELGNEVNGFAVFHGPDAQITPTEYAADIETLRTLRDELDPGTPIAGPAVVVWPETGEPLVFIEEFIELAGDRVDILTWHFYPAFSRRCPLATRWASPEVWTTQEALDDVGRWAQVYEAARDEHAPGVPLWISESGSAYCGGEPEASTGFSASFWWLDELGQMARRGQQVVVRQNLSGADYGLINEETLEPNPDYWASVMWQRWMGTRVLDAAEDHDALRAYAHCAVEGTGGSVLLINPAEEALTVALRGFEAAEASLYVADAAELSSPDVRINGEELRTEADGAPTAWTAVAAPRAEAAFVIRLPGRSYAFVVADDAIAGCE